MKRILSVLLALALGLALCMPAFAATPVLGGPNAPIITKQWQYPSKLKVGDTLKLEIEAKLPEDVDGKLEYAWYDYTWETYNILRDPIATGSKYELVITEDMEDSAIALTVVATNTYTDENGDEQIACTKQNGWFTVDYTVRWWQWILMIPLLPFIIPGAMIFGMGWVGPLIIAIAPFLPVIAILRVIDSIFGTHIISG